MLFVATISDDVLHFFISFLFPFVIIIYHIPVRLSSIFWDFFKIFFAIIIYSFERRAVPERRGALQKKCLMIKYHQTPHTSIRRTHQTQEP
jgi:hypothetical protein